MVRRFPALSYNQYDVNEFSALQCRLEVPFESMAFLHGDTVKIPENLSSVEAPLTCFLCPFVDMVCDKYPSLYERMKLESLDSLPRVVKRLV